MIGEGVAKQIEIIKKIVSASDAIDRNFHFDDSNLSKFRCSRVDDDDDDDDEQFDHCE